ncbi:MAG TPA: PspC domain-containing protein [Beutenbergiaceae bacterium]|nr:PspC domain-containing protein [Beutenbergiaceae bacterium]
MDNSFFTWIRDTGFQRSDDRWFAGVASGVAHKIGVDPLLVRGVFVVLAFLGGPGLALYLLGWLFLPDSKDKIHVQQLMRGQAHTGVVVGVVVVGVLLFATLVSGVNFIRWDVWNIVGVPRWLDITLSWTFWIAICAGAAYLVHLIVVQHGRNQDQRATRPVTAPTAEAPNDPPATSGVDHDDAAPSPGSEDSASAPTGDESVPASPSAGERARAWTAEYARWHDHRRVGRGHVLVTIALALIGGGVAALWAQTSGIAAHVDVPSTSVAVFIAGALGATAVVAGSIIVAGLRGRSSAGLGFFATLGVVALVVTAVLPWGTDYYAVGNNTIDDPSSSIFVAAGNSTIALDQFDSHPQEDSVEIHQLLGDVTLELPSQRPTDLTLVVTAGNINSVDGLWPDQSGLLTRRTITVNDDAPGPPLEVLVRIIAGTITVGPTS